MSFPALSRDTRAADRCQACRSDRVEYKFTVGSAHVSRCGDCALLFLRDAHGAPPARAGRDLEARVRDRVAHLRARTGKALERVLVVVPAGSAVRVDGADVVCADALDGARGAYDAAVCVDVVDRVEDADAWLSALARVLGEGALASFTVASVDSASARYAGAAWSGFRAGGLRFYSVDTLQNTLVAAGFRFPRVYVDGAVRAHSVRLRTAAAALRAIRLRTMAVRALRRTHLLDGLVTLICERREPIRRHRLSVIVPVYNERRTFRELMDQLVAKRLDDADIEIVIVESNSTDGSRDDVLAFAAHPRVEVVLQDAARGKGNAVRAGLACATGDIVLFQDADLEYEIEDYDDLLRPIIAYQRNFVIGARHDRKGGAWKMREFNGAPVLSQVFNFGHLLFLGLLNGVYSQSMGDPFSMFKVFRRDCLAGLEFECDRFDFDFEIVIKLLRKGYHPLELPVNYHSRSIAEGKKVTMVRDPLTWLRALARYRTSELYPGEADRPR